MMKRMPSVLKSFVVQYRSPERRPRRTVIGRYELMTWRGTPIAYEKLASDLQRRERSRLSRPLTKYGYAIPSEVRLGKQTRHLFNKPSRRGKAAYGPIVHSHQR